VPEPRIVRLPTFSKPFPVRERWRTARVGMTMTQLLSLGIWLSDIRHFLAKGRIAFDPPVHIATRPPGKPRERGKYQPAYLRPSDKPRRCLRCSRMFASQGPHNRLCDPCRAAIGTYG